MTCTLCSLTRGIVHRRHVIEHVCHGANAVSAAKCYTLSVQQQSVTLYQCSSKVLHLSMQQQSVTLYQCSSKVSHFSTAGRAGAVHGWSVDEEADLTTTRLSTRQCEMSVTRHTSHVTRHTSHVTRHTSHVTRHGCTVRAKGVAKVLGAKGA